MHLRELPFQTGMAFHTVQKNKLVTRFSYCTRGTHTPVIHAISFHNPYKVIQNPAELIGHLHTDPAITVYIFAKFHAMAHAVDLFDSFTGSDLKNLHFHFIGTYIDCCKKFHTHTSFLSYPSR